MRKLVVTALKQIEVSAEGDIWGAHAGCAAIAGALLVTHNLVSAVVRSAVQLRVETLLREHSGAASQSAPISRRLARERILNELAMEACEPKALGHGVIYSAYVLRALEAFDIQPWQSLVDAVTLLLRKIREAGPGWITINGSNEHRPFPDAIVEDAPIKCLEIFSLFERSRRSEADDMQLGHLLTHGHAIEVLRDYCAEDLIEALSTAYRRRINCLKIAAAEERELAPLRRTPIDPAKPAYWAKIAELGDMHHHALKYAYSYLDLCHRAAAKPDFTAFGRIAWPDVEI